MKYLKAISLLLIGLILMKITNNLAYEIIMENSQGISKLRALLTTTISMIPIAFFIYRAFLCLGWYKKEDFRLGKKDNHALSKEDYAEALNEFENNRDEQLWTKHFAESDGDESKAKARYLKDRAEILSTEDKNQLDRQSSLNKLSDEEREKMYQSLQDYKDDKL